VAEFEKLSFSPSMFVLDGDDGPFRAAYASDLRQSSALLKSMVDELNEYGLSSRKQLKDSIESEIERLCGKFHIVAKQLQRRYANRAPYTINDEYDLQDFFHALLRLFFDDVRAEEWTPSYAGKAARTDFLLKKEKTVIELKMTRKGLGEKQIGEQLIIDIERYKSHPDCSSLYCFVYDPEGYVHNPDGLEADLSRIDDRLKRRVIVRPR
jgi:hypothetical protein